ncbi:MAG: response regulator [Sutterellaceae bacterium]|nr:response regulator [Burkholderiaceae bacterium]MCX7901697.1 response regulator [Burkholderiaceae bacterium]MDW8429104.1 response regulator [Sutterellaceae bacterium]
MASVAFDSKRAAAKPRILIADDSHLVRASLTQSIRDHFDIREVADGEAAWQAILLDAAIRVVITDLAMPRVDGFELLTRVRSSKVSRIRDLPVIVITSPEEVAERERARAAGATDFLDRSASSAELTARLEVLVRLSTTREALQESQALLESARTVDPDTELLALPFFDKQVEKLISFARRNLSDVALICVRVELTAPGGPLPEAELEQRAKLVGRALAASIRLEDLGTRTDRLEFCVATQSTGLSGVLRFAARLRKVLENVEAAGPGVEVWTCLGVATLSEELRRSGEELRLIASRRAQLAQATRSRRIILGAAEGAPGDYDTRPDDGSMDIGLALALIRAGRAAEVVPHLPRLLEQLTPLLRLVRQQRELQASGSEGGTDDNLQGVPRAVDR